MPDNTQPIQTSQEMPQKKKVSIGTIIIFVILLIILGVVGSYFLSDETQLGDCEDSEDCRIYNVFYIKGEGYVCVNDLKATDTSVKTKVLMLKYAGKNAVESEPAGCLCTAGKCEVD